MARALYRSSQVLHALWPRLTPADAAYAREVLGTALLRLFEAMERRDQRHAFAVARRLRDTGVSDKDLLAAALLHDCGKGAAPIWLRIVKVLSPRLLQRLADEGGSGWRRAAFRLARHAELGARLALAAGASAATASYISGHVGPAEAGGLALLVAADDAS